jgi:uncharacterized protein involved in exopolysaccharide biosynthesis
MKPIVRKAFYFMSPSGSDRLPNLIFGMFFDLLLVI